MQKIACWSSAVRVLAADADAVVEVGDEVDPLDVERDVALHFHHAQVAVVAVVDLEQLEPAAVADFDRGQIGERRTAAGIGHRVKHLALERDQTTPSSDRKRVSTTSTPKCSSATSRAHFE